MPTSHTEAKRNTKIEELAEALENLSIGVSSSALNKVDSDQAPHPMVRQFLEDARLDIRVKLAAFLQPALNLIEGGVRQPYPSDTPAGDIVTCEKCKHAFICSDTSCPWWHKAVRKHEEEKLAAEDDGPEVA